MEFNYYSIWNMKKKQILSNKSVRTKINSNLIDR